MTIAIHEPSNSLIVTAPEQLFQEVSQLVKLIDARSVQSVEIISSSKAAAYSGEAAAAVLGRPRDQWRQARGLGPHGAVTFPGPIVPATGG